VRERGQAVSEPKRGERRGNAAYAELSQLTGPRERRRATMRCWAACWATMTGLRERKRPSGRERRPARLGRKEGEERERFFFFLFYFVFKTKFNYKQNANPNIVSNMLFKMRTFG